MNFDEQRKHIHDLANSMSIVDASISRVLTLLKRNHPELTDELTRLGKADEYSKKAIDTLRSLREVVHNQMKELGQ
jgi:hypothetical protein